MSSLVKFTTDESLDLELAVIRKSRPNCNTNAGAAKYAINHYLSECEDHTRTKKELETYKERLHRVEMILLAQQNVADDIDDYLRSLAVKK